MYSHQAKIFWSGCPRIQIGKFYYEMNQNEIDIHQAMLMVFGIEYLREHICYTKHLS
ncbi:hypothetical protein [Helicobacter sp. 12S02634-8]|uniref:hypothetical protein n=1 Tax=Helicobacter sp. 12S02634-8 TaxID=1476199 RepID=UPI001556B25E|nr:hypothetical protein [Helicobacter sp. 12S02634-8]